MTLNEIITNQSLSNYGKRQEILMWDGHGEPYRVTDDNCTHGEGIRFHSLKVARVFAGLLPTKDVYVVGPDATCYEPIIVGGVPTK